VGVVFGQLHAQASSLHPDGGVALRIEIGRPPEYLGRDLVLLEGRTGVIERMFGEVVQQFAEGLRSAQAMTISKPIYLLEALLPSPYVGVRQRHLTEV